MSYDIIGGDTLEENITFFTIGDLLKLASEHPTQIFRFIGTKYSVGELHSWCGSYNIAAISYVTEERTGAEIFKSLEGELGQTHYGYKGVEFFYGSEEEFYISDYGHCSEYKVVGYTVTDEEVILNTKIDPY